MKNTALDKIYTETFYDNQVEGSMKSANRLLSILYNIYTPDSVLDIGCGRGAWLATCENLGSRKLVGIDGPWVVTNKLLSPNIEFHERNFEDNITIEGKFDLAMSLEVAEHIEEKNASSFVSALCNASNVIVFGAAASNQGGSNHINEQPQSYWINLFNNEGYDHFDIFRGTLWEEQDVKWWYKQNTFLFVKQTQETPRLPLDHLKALEATPINITHPDNLQGKCFQILENEQRMRTPTIKFISTLVSNYIRTKCGFNSEYK